MQLVERYLQAVKFWLPKQQKQDIIAELSEDIYTQLEEQETALGRKLTDGELEHFLRQRGRPVVVANSYSPQEYLIGPMLFPVYRFVLKVVALCYLLPWLLVDLGVQALRHTWIQAFLHAVGHVWFVAFTSLATVTIVFAILERAQAKSHFLENWSPRRLPALHKPNLISRLSSSVEIAVNLIFLVWWASSLSSRIIAVNSDLTISLSPIWPWFFWGFLSVALANALLAARNLMRPYWTWQRAAFRLLTDAAAAALFCWLMGAGVLAGITVTNMPAERAIEITNLITLWLARSYPAAVVACVVIVSLDVARIVRLKLSNVHLIQEAAV